MCRHSAAQQRKSSQAEIQVINRPLELRIANTLANAKFKNPTDVCTSKLFMATF